MKKNFKNFLYELFFPKFCLNCKRERSFLCQDCAALFEISGFHKVFKTKYLDDLYFALEYKNPLIKKLIQNYKYEPFIKELSKPLSSLLFARLQLLEIPLPIHESIIIPVPLEKKRLKWRGFNHAEKLAVELSDLLSVLMVKNVLIKKHSTVAQTKLSGNKRRENLFGVFACQDKSKIKNKKILLVDDIYTTGSTLEATAKVLKSSGAKEIIGMVIAKAKPKH